MDGISDGMAVALIGVVGALLTVVITVVGAGIVASRQLRHDREERATDRALQSKRDQLFTSLAAAAEVTRSISSLARPGSDISETADRFSAAVTRLAAAGSVASLEVVERGRDLVGQAGVLFMVAMAKRASLQKDDPAEKWAEFGDWTIDAQVKLQRIYGLLLAAVRRDLRIPDSDDDQVLKATAADVKAIESATAEAREILLSSG